MMLSDISCMEAKALLDQGGQLVDVRSQREYAMGALPGAVNVPLEAINDVQRLLDNSKPVILYCVTGLRSGKAKMILQSLGYDAVHNLGAFRNFNC